MYPESLTDQLPVKEAFELTRQNFRCHTGMEPSHTMENTSYQFRYQYLQLDLITLMVWEGSNRKIPNKIPKFLCIAPFKNKLNNWAPPDNSERDIVSLVNKN